MLPVHQLQLVRVEGLPLEVRLPGHEARRLRELRNSPPSHPTISQVSWSLVQEFFVTPLGQRKEASASQTCIPPHSFVNLLIFFNNYDKSCRKLVDFDQLCSLEFFHGDSGLPYMEFVP